MTEFIIGTSGSGKGEYIIEKIKERLGGGRKMYLIVPEQQAVLWEAKICRVLPPSSALELETLSFRRLADTVFRTYGGQNTVFSGKADKLINMWRAVTSVKDSLRHYAGSEGHEEKYVPLLLETFTELKSRGVTIKALEDAEHELEGERSESLRDKLSDLSLICSAYNAICEEKESEDPDNVLDMLAKSLRTHPFFKDCDVFIDSFYSLTPMENEILYYIMRDCSDLFITFTMDGKSAGTHFDHVRKFRDGALVSAEACHRAVTTVELGENKRCRSDELIYLGDELWNFAAKKREDIKGGDVRIVRCADRYEEAACAGAMIESAVHGGASYSNIALIARDIERYRGILDVRLDSLGIPYHLSKRNSIATSPALTLISSLLSAVSDNFRGESVVKCIKTGLCPVTVREAENFEEYVATWNIRGRNAYLKTDKWTKNPSGYKSELSEWASSVLEDANRVKEVMSGAFSSLSALFSGGRAKIGDAAAALYDILVSFDVYGTLTGDADELERNGRKEEAEICEKSYSAVIDALNALAAGAGDTMIGAGAMARLFTMVASSFDIGSIPSGIDMVTLGSASGVRCENITHAILLGCSEGEFPASPKENGFFNETDRVTLETLGIDLSDGPEAETGEEMFRFWRCVTLPSEKLTVTYPAKNEEGDVAPSVGARQIMKLLGLDPVDYASLPPEEVIWSVSGASDPSLIWRSPAAANAAEALGEKYPELKTAKRLSGVLSADNEPPAAQSRRKGRLPLTQSRIDTFSGCPFAYMMKYVMKLGENSRASVGASDVGNLVHRVLELFFSETAERKFPIPDEEAGEIVDRVTKEYISEIMRGTEASSRQKYLFTRLRRNVLILVKAIMEEFAETDFRPYRFELPMGGGEGCPEPLEFTASDGTKISLYGTIDRVDTFVRDGKAYVRVIDYKTFGKTFKLDDIQKGINLQLLIYLFTLWKGRGSFRTDLTPNGEEILPAGMIYLSAEPDSASSASPVDEEEARALAFATVGRSGVLLKDETSLAAMGSALGKKYINLRKTDLFDLEEMGRLYDEIEDVIKRIGETINSGECRSMPRQLTSRHPCEYCKMKPICRHTEERRTDDE